MCPPLLAASVSPPHHVYDHPAEALLLLLAEILEDVTVFLLQQLEAYGQVVVLQHRLIVVHQGQLRVWGEAGGEEVGQRLPDTIFHLIVCHG